MIYNSSAGQDGPPRNFFSVQALVGFSVGGIILGFALGLPLGYFLGDEEDKSWKKLMVKFVSCLSVKSAPVGVASAENKYVA